MILDLWDGEGDTVIPPFPFGALAGLGLGVALKSKVERGVDWLANIDSVKEKGSVAVVMQSTVARSYITTEHLRECKGLWMGEGSGNNHWPRWLTW